MSMGTETTMGDSQQPGRADPSEHDARELVERLRSAPAEEIITELFSTMLSTAQVKLGRRDARLFIDLCAQGLEYAGRYLPRSWASRSRRRWDSSGSLKSALRTRLPRASPSPTI